MANLPSFLIRGRHSELDMPWYSDDANGDGTDKAGQTIIADWCLHRYLSEGGIKAFASTSIRSMVLHRQNRFLCLCGVLAVLWLIFLLV